MDSPLFALLFTLLLCFSVTLCQPAQPCLKSDLKPNATASNAAEQAAATTPATTHRHAPASASPVEVIDLTLCDDDDDEAPLPTAPSVPVVAVRSAAPAQSHRRADAIVRRNEACHGQILTSDFFFGGQGNLFSQLHLVPEFCPFFPEASLLQSTC